MKKGNTDNRTLPEIYKDLTTEEKRILIGKIVSQGRTSATSAYAYVQGKRTPQFLYQQMISLILKSEFQIVAPIKTLFPNE